jgi:hypothetical protein
MIKGITPMISRIFSSNFNRLFLAFTLFFLYTNPRLSSAATAAVTLQYEMQTLDLETGSVFRFSPKDFDTDANECDLQLAYHADHPPHTVIVPMNGSGIAILNGSEFATVSASNVSDQVFSNETLNIVLKQTGTALIKTRKGGVYKIGNTAVDGFSVTFDYQRLR